MSDKKKITVKVDLDDVIVSIEKAIPVGLIVNEVVTNSIKYAFKRGEEEEWGEISVSLKSKGKGVILALSDDGVGLPGGFDMEGNKSLGMQTIIILCEKQLNGEVSLGQGEDENGIKWIIEFKNDEK